MVERIEKYVNIEIHFNGGEKKEKQMIEDSKKRK